jgi:GT2 family glycosyltransferase
LTLALSESDITVAILNWNGLHHLKQFLPSVLAHSGNARIRVIDNASTDDSVAWLRETHPQVELDILDRNHGFTGGYNIGIQNISTPLVVLLNSDVETSPSWIVPLLALMNSKPGIAACQPKILSWAQPNQFEYAGAAGGFIDSYGYPFCRGRLFGSCELDEGQYNQARPVFWASGACMMIRRDEFIKTGGLETRFFAHMEEIDLCWRLWHREKEVWVEPASVVLHLGAGTLAKTSPRKTFLNFRNGFAMLFINSSGDWAAIRIASRLVLDGLAGLQFLLKGEFASCLAIIRAHFAFYAGIGYWLKRRQENSTARTSAVPHKVIFRGSLVYAYFLLGKRKFSQLLELRD